MRILPLLRFCVAGSSGLIACAGAHATTWVADFTSSPPESVTGIDENMVVTYADAANPPSGTKTWVISNPPDYTNVPDGWLTQGSIADVPTTLKFFNQPGDSKGGRTRFSTELPGSINLSNGATVAWKARYGNYVIGRGPFQFAAKSANGTMYGGYFKVLNGTQALMQLNGGGALNNISTLTIPNVADGAYHQWAVGGIVLSDGLSHWKLWLDGTLLLFAGTDGAHMIDPTGGSNPQQFSFKIGVSTYTNPIAGASASAPFISLGEVQNATFDQWDFEFDCVAYRDDGIVENFTCGSPAPPCDSTVGPTAAQTITALKNGAPSLPSITYTFVNAGSGPVSYTVAETDANGVSQDHSWLSLNKSSGGPIAVSGNDPVIASIISTNLPHGTHTGYVTFTDNCTPPKKHTRVINLVITDCASSVSPASEIARSIMSGESTSLDNGVFTLTNTGTDGLTYSVTKEGDCSWVSLNKSVLGPLSNGQSESVHAIFSPGGVPAGVHTCTIRFVNTRPDCSNALDDIVRTVTLNVVEKGNATQQLNAEFTSFTDSDIASSSPLISCDPYDTLSRLFFVDTNSAMVSTLPSGWLTQGTILVPATAKFFNAPDGNTGRARFRVMQGLNDEYDPAKGLSVAYRVKLGNVAIVRGPIHIYFAAVPGPFATDPFATLIPDASIFSCFVRVQNGTNVSILRNGGQQYPLDTLVLPQSIADEYHQWTVSACYNTVDHYSYWNVWLDGVKLMFTGSNADGTAGSPTGPGGQVYSYRLPFGAITSDPFVSLGEIGTPPDVWDIEFDWMRLVAWNVSGLPFWNGEGCLDKPCPIPRVDADEDGDVDLNDFAQFQACFTGSFGMFDKPRCRCFDTNSDLLVDDMDFQKFTNCATRSGVPWVSSVGCP